MSNENKNSNNLLGSYYGTKFSGAIFCFLMVFYVFITFIGQLVLSACGVNFESTLYIAISGCFSIIAIILVLIMARFGKKQTFSSLLSIKKCGVIWYIIAVLLFIGMFFGLGFINVHFTDFLNKIFNITPLEIGKNFTLTKYVVLSITLAILPAVFEELFFRGILLNSLISGGKLFAVILSSICFSIYHCSISQLIYQFVFGLAFSLIAINSKSILPCIVAHFLNNFIILTAYYFKIESSIFSTLTIVIGFIALAIFILFIVYICVRNKVFKTKSGGEKNALNNFIVPFGVGGVAVCLMLIVLGLL